mmetsp:Transcript_31238/g.83807  ORF Transcript_31238/g.83807 Transcript_31238/m.83807 type:complete len:314 (-) Transcript_31238:169-1110(-)
MHASRAGPRGQGSAGQQGGRRERAGVCGWLCVPPAEGAGGGGQERFDERQSSGCHGAQGLVWSFATNAHDSWWRCSRSRRGESQREQVQSWRQGLRAQAHIPTSSRRSGHLRRVRQRQGGLARTCSRQPPAGYGGRRPSRRPHGLAGPPRRRPQARPAHPHLRRLGQRRPLRRAVRQGAGAICGGDGGSEEPRAREVVWGGRGCGLRGGGGGAAVPLRRWPRHQVRHPPRPHRRPHARIRRGGAAQTGGRRRARADHRIRPCGQRAPRCCRQGRRPAVESNVCPAQRGAAGEDQRPHRRGARQAQRGPHPAPR